jgi:DNA-binding beta-propeller fold protein YncE
LAIALASLLSAALAQGQNLFVTSSAGGNPNDHHIYEFTPDGTRSTFASSLASGEGLAFDSAGNLFESDWDGNVFEFMPGRAQSTFASGLGHLYGMAFNNAGNLFVVAGWPSGTIYQFTPQGVRSTFASGLNGPYGLAFNSMGDLFVSDEYGGEIYKITPGGSRSTFASGLIDPTGLAFDSAGNLLVSQGSPTYPNGSGNITKFTPKGTSSTFASSGLGNLPYGLAFDSAGNLFVASAYIYKIAPDGTQSIFAGNLDSPGFLAFQLVPEPSTWVMVGIGAVALFGIRRRGY